MSEFTEISKECARVLRRVLSGHIKTRDELMSSWPKTAGDFEVLDSVLNNVFEMWLLEPHVKYRDVLEKSAAVLERAPDDPIETKLRIDAAIDSD